MREFDAIGLGMNCVDCLLRVSSTADLAQEPEILEWSIQGGGKVATAMAAISRLGAKAAIMTKIGDDEPGRFVLSDFERYRVNVDHVIVQEGCRTNVNFVLVDQNTGVGRWVRPEVIRDWNLPEPTRTALEWAREGPKSVFRNYTGEELEFVGDCKILNLDGFLPEDSLEAAKTAKTKGIAVCYDMYSHPNITELLRNITYCIPSRRAATTFTKETDPRTMCRALLKFGPPVVGVTLGEDGVLFMTANETLERRAFKVPIVDTTGAGDVFHGAFSFGVMNGWSLTAIVEFASAVSALKCRRLGGRAGIPTLSEVESFLNENVKEIRLDS